MFRPSVRVRPRRMLSFVAYVPKTARDGRRCCIVPQRNVRALRYSSSPSPSLRWSVGPDRAWPRFSGFFLTATTCKSVRRNHAIVVNDERTRSVIRFWTVRSDEYVPFTLIWQSQTPTRRPITRVITAIIHCARATIHVLLLRQASCS